MMPYTRHFKTSECLQSEQYLLQITVKLNEKKLVHSSVPVGPDFPRPDLQTWIVVMLSSTVRIYAEKYRNFWEWTPIIHKNRIACQSVPREIAKGRK